MNYCRYLLLFLFCFAAGVLQAQILNDSTQSVYGTKTTRVFFEKDYLRGDYTTRPVDTSLNNMYQTRHWYHDSTFFQDLGNVGTAAKPIFWRFPERIGARYGKDVFDRYMYDADAVAYFDTKSPYSHLYYIQGQQGEQVFEAKHSRSFKNIANVGFAFARMSGNKQIGLPRTNQEGQVDHLAFMLFTHVQNKTGKYHLFANYTTFNHKQIELGGIRLEFEPRPTQDDLFQYKDSPAMLNTAFSQERRNRVHLTHFYTLAKEYIKVYHTIDYRVQKNKFTDTDLDTNYVNKKLIVQFYPGVIIDSAQTNDRGAFKELENTVGITGNHPLFVYRVYAKRRDGNAYFRTLNSNINPENNSFLTYEEKFKLGQNFIGGETQFKLKDIFNITAIGEYQLFKDYIAQVSARVKFLTVSQTRSSYSPTLMQQAFVSNHYRWDNNFDNIVADRTAAGVNLKLLGNHIQAEVSRTNLQNYVIYDTSGISRQLGNQLSFYTATLRHRFQFKSLHFDHFVSVQNNNNAEEIRMPNWLVNSKIYLQGFLFKKALFSQMGIETYVADNYYADAYAPGLQQFHIQNEFRVNNPLVNSIYPVVDLFLAADIKSFNLFLKMAHVNQGFPEKGYFSTPYYPGMQRSFVFGIKWMFFD